MVPQLGATGYAFPVYGTSAFGDGGRPVKYLRFDAGTGWRPTVLAADAPTAGAVLLRFSLDPALAR